MAGALDNFRVIVGELPKMAPITVRGVEYTGPQLSWWVAVNPEQPLHEANRTPQLYFELGRLCAAALADYEFAEAKHVAFKEGLIYALATDKDTAVKYGLMTEEETKLPAKGVADSYVHSLPEYVESKNNMFRLAEAHRVLQYALEAAKLRREAIIVGARTEGVPTGRDPVTENPHSPANGSDGTTTFHQGYGEVVEGNRQPRMSLREQEDAVRSANQTRTPLPSLGAASGPPVTIEAPPPPPAAAPPPPPKKKAPPPPRKGT